MTHTGPYAELHKAYRFLFGNWLVESGENPKRVPAFERYLNTPADTAPQNLETEIMVALV
nr:GyrI-like domain-containing protein [Pseudohoeflea sp. DP4N28-3]